MFAPVKSRFNYLAFAILIILSSCQIRSTISGIFVFDNVFRLYSESVDGENFYEEDTLLTRLSTYFVLAPDLTLEMHIISGESFSIIATGTYRIEVTKPGHSGAGTFSISNINSDVADVTFDVTFSNSWDMFFTLPQSLLPSKSEIIPILDFRRWGS